MQAETLEVIKDIRKRCRMAMNGVTSASMRNYGLNYKLNFGVSIGQIREIAACYKPNLELAEYLWKENVRELKILATLLYPQDKMTKEGLMRWIREIPNQEIREQMGFNMIKYYPETFGLGIECANDEDSEVRISGYWFVGRHLMTEDYKTEIKLGSFPYVWDDIIKPHTTLRNAVKLFLRNMGRISPAMSELILKKLSKLKDSDDLTIREIYHSLSFDFNYFCKRFIPKE
jgi:hypothetical protein